MDTSIHTINLLFEQLGLESSDEAIQQFINQYSPLPDNIALGDAEFWSESQAIFLHRAKEEDADWAEIVDQLDVLLR